MVSKGSIEQGNTQQHPEATAVTAEATEAAAAAEATADMG